MSLMGLGVSSGLLSASDDASALSAVLSAVLSAALSAFDSAAELESSDPQPASPASAIIDAAESASSFFSFMANNSFIKNIDLPVMFFEPRRGHIVL